jgi:hypothetical protein
MKPRSVPPRIEIRVDRLIARGLRARDLRDLAPAIEQELQRRLSRRAAVEAGESGFAQQIASTIHKEIGGKR